tara:strand:- start:5438 stop:6667 length:1230 start_codon:yes stop_codon:yes gene_type:complete
MFTDLEFLEKSANSLENNIVDFLCDLVSIQSVNGTNPEKHVADRITLEAKKLNLPFQIKSQNKDRPNVLVSYGNGPLEFLFVAHMDTVSPGDINTWKSNPFQGVKRNDRIYGRGTADNKAGIACALYTIAMMKNLSIIQNNMKITLAAVSDEESGATSKIGVRHLINTNSLNDAKGAIYTYASDNVCIGHRGLLRLEITTIGKSVHTGGNAWNDGIDGINAVTGLAAILLKLESTKIDFTPHKSFGTLRNIITPGTIFNGGEFESVVPNSATAIVDIRLLPETDYNSIINLIKSLIIDETKQRPGIKYNLSVKNKLPAVVLDENHPLVTTTVDIAQKITRQEWNALGAGPANEGYMLIKSGIPTLCGFGPKGDNAHGANEWIEINSLSTTTAIYAAVAEQYLSTIENNK